MSGANRITAQHIHVRHQCLRLFMLKKLWILSNCKCHSTTDQSSRVFLFLKLRLGKIQVLVEVNCQWIAGDSRAGTKHSRAAPKCRFFFSLQHRYWHQLEVKTLSFSMILAILWRSLWVKTIPDNKDQGPKQLVWKPLWSAQKAASTIYCTFPDTPHLFWHFYTYYTNFILGSLSSSDNLVFLSSGLSKTGTW